MFVTQEVEDSMDHQKDDRLHLIETETIRLAPGGVDRNDYVTQDLRMEGRKVSLSHGEGKDIRWLIAAEVASIQFLYLDVVDERDAQFNIGRGHFSQDRFGRPS